MCRISISLIIVLLMALAAKSQNNITGKIVTIDGEPAANVNIEIKELKQFDISNETGIFDFNDLPDGTYHLTVSYTGLHTQQQEITLRQNGVVRMYIVLKENADQLEEVFINSRKGLNNQLAGIGKLPVNPMDLPQSIMVVGQSLIRDQQSQRLSDIIKNVNGVYLATTRASTQESFSARGYSFSSSNMFKNGSRVNTGTMPEVSSLEKVEILKGSAAILYGNVLLPGASSTWLPSSPDLILAVRYHFVAEVMDS